MLYEHAVHTLATGNPTKFIYLANGKDFSEKIKAYPNPKEALQSLTHTAQWILWDIISQINIKNNVAFYTPISSTAKQRLFRGYRLLYELNILHRIKRQTYLLNPKIIILDLDQFDEILEYWNFIKLKEKINKQIQE